MSTTKPTKRKRPPMRAAFVVTTSLTTAVTAVAAVGCWGSTTNPPSIDCPAAVPDQGTDCTEADLDGSGGVCTYPDECNVEIEAHCGEDGKWDIQFTGTCNPPPPEECPTNAPLDGDSCSEPMNCTYEDPCETYITAECDGNTWSVEESIESCNPPPPCPSEMPAEGEECENTPGGFPVDCTFQAETACGTVSVPGECVDDGQNLGIYVWSFAASECTPTQPACGIYEHSDLCDADTSCRWLVPGCGEGEPNFETGCFPIDNCTIDSCGRDSECTPVVYNPCWNELCDACGADASICMPTMGGA